MKRYDYGLLVVADFEFINSALCDLIQKSHTPSFKVYRAQTLNEARDIIENQLINFVIFDLELFDGAGEEFMGYLGATELYLQSKVIVLTNSKDKKRRDHLFKLGIIDCLSKEHSTNFLVNEIEKSILQFTSHQHTNILLVDDSDYYTNHIEAILQNQNYHVEALHSMKVYEFLKKNQVNLLIVNSKMLENNNYELLSMIRQDDDLLDLPIIAISDQVNHDLRVKLLKRSVTDLLTKPFMIENLILKVDIAVSLYKKQRKLMDLNEYLEEELQQNIEEIRKKDQLLELNNRHAQIGAMLNSLTHQWKQPLYAVGLSTEYIKQISKNEEVIQTVKTVQEQVAFLTDTMIYFRNFFKTTQEKEVFSLVKAFENVLKLLGETYGNINFSFNGNPKLCIEGYLNEFYQVIINIMNNAQDAFKKNKIANRKINIDVAEDGNYIVLNISDNAGGIANDVIESVFTQYVSTKEDGNGIGLHMSRLIIEKIKGTIEVENINHGACFTIKFPHNSALCQAS